MRPLDATVGDSARLMGSPIPTQNEIKKRMGKRFGRIFPLMDELLTPCAEEAELLVLEALSQAGDPQAVTIKAQGYKQYKHRSKIKLTGYRCPCCKADVRYRDRFCGGCGKPINWLDRTGQ